MEQSSAQNPMPGLPHVGVPQDALPAEYWNTLDSIYPDSQLQTQVPQPQDPSTQGPIGISWDHPVFQQQQPQPQQPQHQWNPLAAQPSPNHGIYSSMPPTRQSNPLQPSPRAYGVSPQYQTHQQIPQYQQQSQMAFDTRPLTPSESSSFPSYSSFPSNYYHPQQLSMQDSYAARNFQPPQPPQQPQQSAEYAAPTPQSAMPQFTMPPGFPSDILHDTIDLTGDFSSSEPGVSHQTIDPQFLNPVQSSNQPQSLANSFLHTNPPNFDRPDGRIFNYFENDLAVQPQISTSPHLAMGMPAGMCPLPTLSSPVTSTKLSSGGFPSKLPSHPQSQVLIEAPKKTAPKKQTQPKKAGAKTSKKVKAQSDSESSDGSDLEVDPEPSPAPSVRPSDPIGAAHYDTIKAVWSPRNLRASADTVKAALVAFKDVVKALRDSWKDQVQAMKTAENQGDNEKATKLKQDVALQRRIMEKIVTTTLDTGHPVVIEKLGEHPVALSVFYSFLTDRFQAADLEGSLTLNILKLLAHFITVDEELLQKTNMAKLLPRFVKKGSPSVKELAQTILDNAAASSKRKQNNTKSGKEDSPTKNSARDSPSVELAGYKRPRDGESNVPPATKRMVVTSNPKDAAKSTVANGSAKRPSEGVQNGKAVNTTAPRPKTNIVAPKPTSLFSALNSASKRPGTTNAERKATAAAKPTPPPETKEKPVAPPPKPAFSFGDLMADLNKPKENVVVKPAEDIPPETEEERTKRLRKEARRKMRVTWKPDDSLTEVRLFTHDPDEELGPGDGSMHGLGDVKGEGSVLKLHKDLEELEEDDLGGIREITLDDYTGLSGKPDMSQMYFSYRIQTNSQLAILTESEELKQSNFIKGGGARVPDSPEKEAQDQRESTTLMVFYTSPADVPPSPKEPPASDTDEVAPEKVAFGEVPDYIKARDERYFEFMNPKPAVTSDAAAQPSSTTGGFDISNLLKLINNSNQQQSTPPPQPPQPAPQQAPMSDLERTISMFRQQQAQPQVPQVPQIPTTIPSTQPSAAPGSVDFTKLLSVMQQMQQGSGLQQPQQPQQSQPNMMPNLGAIFSQFTGQNQQGVAQYPPQPQYEDPERKRMREGGQYDEEYDSQWSRQKRTKSNDPKPYKVGLVACRFWAEGKCRKGENCTFRHEN
ncbi:hypothetical protein N7462_002101 [Penicillium macrosclerotiorum]|uniref:uncharacterized protein n=1 Tax=Penicillium macrosclerotiorum TaxID=303699 RepID=UPI0025494899|nr:uncharacterized protein N7462_002101 [Penicillium macrosclerotiorum]KAJ5692678.1 hypothetical protein N7462_002101 [Penicillium macrosclerotiorum]